MTQGTQSAQVSQKQDWRNIYAIMKAICLPVYRHNRFVATHALRHLMYGYIFHTCIYMHGIHLEAAIESWPEWDLNSRPLNSVQTL